jgi:hypothetical protein
MNDTDNFFTGGIKDVEIIIRTGYGSHIEQVTIASHHLIGKEVARFVNKLFRYQKIAAAEVRVQSDEEDKHHKQLSMEYRRGHLAGVEEGIRQERRNE